MISSIKNFFITKLIIICVYFSAVVFFNPLLGMEGPKDNEMDESTFSSLESAIREQDLEYFLGIYESIKPTFSISRRQILQIQNHLTYCEIKNCNAEHCRVNKIVLSFCLDALLNIRNNIKIKDIPKPLAFIFVSLNMESLKLLASHRDFDVNRTDYFPNEAIFFEDYSEINLIFLSVFYDFKEGFNLLIRNPNFDPNVCLFNTKNRAYTTIMEILVDLLSQNDFPSKEYYLKEIIKKGGVLFGLERKNQLIQFSDEKLANMYGVSLGDIPTLSFLPSSFYKKLGTLKNIIYSRIVSRKNPNLNNDDELWKLDVKDIELIHFSCSICLQERVRLIKLDCCGTKVCSECQVDSIKYKLKNIGTNSNLGECEKCFHKISLSSLFITPNIFLSDIYKLNDILYNISQSQKKFIPCPNKECNMWTYPSEKPRWYYCKCCEKKLFFARKYPKCHGS